MAETRAEAIGRLQDLRRKLMFSSEEDARLLLEHFQPVICLSHEELAHFNLALIKHSSPKDVKKALDEILCKIQP